MSSTSGGKAAPAPRDRLESVVITSTQSPAAAFGEDIADDAYSLSELSHVEDEKRARRARGQGQSGVTQPAEGREAFLRNTIGRAGAGLSRLQSYVDESQSSQSSTSSSGPTYQPVPTVQNGQRDPSDGAGSDASPELSPDGSGNDVDADDGDSATSTDSSYAQFARARFHMKGTTTTYSCAALPGPLLYKEDRADYLASLASWVLILRIMGDLPDKDLTEILQVAGQQPPVISLVRNYFKRKYTKKDIEEAHAKYSELFKDPQGTDMLGIPFLPDRCDTMLEKVQFVCSLGIYKPALRDELFCQLCKQLTNNPSRNSTVRGWVLLSLFAGGFAPSEKFASVFNAFLRGGSPDFAQKVDKLVRRTCSVGTRGYPPSWLEFQATKNNKPLLVPVTFMNSFRTLCEVDSASTVQELVHNIAETIGLLDPTGFSIYVTLHTKISCLGHGMHRVMDAISECEQHTKQMGMRESSSLWRLFLRREYLTPWPLPEEDAVSVDLVYQQIMRGVALGEYKCEKDSLRDLAIRVDSSLSTKDHVSQEDVLMLLAAQRFYIENSADIKLEKLDQFVKSWLTEELLGKNQLSYYVDKVRQCLQKNFMTNKPDHHSLKMDMVTFAKDKWFLLLSRFYDAPKVVGPGLSMTKIVVALNNKGVYMMDESDTIRMHIAFWEIAAVTKGRHLTTVRTIKGDDYMVTMYHAEDFFVMLTSFIHGLRMRSRYAVITQDTTQLDNRNDQTLTRGDLVTLAKIYSDTLDDPVLSAVSKRLSSTFEIPRDNVYVMAIAEEPTNDMLGRVLIQLRKDPLSLLNDVDYKPHTLQHYSHLNFRPVSENAVTKFFNKASFKRDKNESLWQHSKEPLKKPLLKRTCAREELKGPACRAFAAIQQYMTDLAVKQEVSDVELVNEYIIDPARRNKYLKDETYCQVIKQLTKNPDKGSEEKGWVLMYLLCATTTPQSDLYDQCLGFLRGSKHPQARACSAILSVQKSSGSRLFPPHALEHDLVGKKQSSVRVQVMLPSGTPVILEVNSRTRISDMKKSVKEKLKLKSVAEYSLFLSGIDSMHSLPDRSFYFDCLTQTESYFSKQRRASTSGAASATPSLVMLKKLWVNVTPEQDPEADRCFHYPQEVPNYLRGYHKCSHQEVIQLASLLYRVRFGADESHFAKFSELAPSMLPRGFPASGTTDDIRKQIEAQYAASNGITQNEARLRFLQIAVTWPTYGSVFFEVKQRALRSLPKYCLLAINTSGVHISDLQTKELLQTLEFMKIPNWAFDDFSFTFIVTGSSGPTKLLFETSVGHNMDDVLMTHITWVMSAHVKRKRGFYNNVGESLC